MTKRDMKSLASAFAALRPRRAGDSERKIWADMIEAASEHLPHTMSNAFVSACMNGGIWSKDYEQ